MSAADLLGASGVSLILLAYFLSLLNRLQQDGVLYLSLNLTGACLACASSVLIGSVPFTVLEGTWALVSLAALMRIAITKRSP